MKKIKLAIVGYGGMGRYHSSHLISKEEKIEVCGIYDIALAARERAVNDGLKTYDDLESLLKDEEVEAVLIATPNDSHLDITVRTMKAGKHVICEKPVALNVLELDEMIKTSEETQKIFMVHQNRRWDHDFLVVEELYKNHQIGELFQLESRVHGANGIPGDWRHKKNHGGGMVLDWGVHLFDQFLYLIDSPVKKVNAQLSYVLGNEVDDGFYARLYFENGLEAIVEVGTSNYLKLPRWYVKGLRGTAIISDWDLSGEMIIRKEGKEPQHANLTPIKAGQGLTKTMAPPSEEETMKLSLPNVLDKSPSFYQNFYEVVRHQSEPIIKNSEVRSVMVLIEAIFKSGQNNQTINLY